MEELLGVPPLGFQVVPSRQCSGRHASLGLLRVGGQSAQWIRRGVPAYRSGPGGESPPTEDRAVCPPFVTSPALLLLSAWPASPDVTPGLWPLSFPARVHVPATDEPYVGCHL